MQIGDFFGNMFLVATSRNLDMRKLSLLKHSLDPLPWPLPKCDGTLKKTNISTLARHFESRVTPAKSIPLPSGCIIDGRAW